ncbi:hypothetical protein L345_17747, partial [Ophiophagus hannah]
MHGSALLCLTKQPRVPWMVSRQARGRALKLFALSVCRDGQRPRHQSKNDPSSTYNEENLAQCIYDFFGAGTDTSFVSMKWALILLANHPDIQ